MVGASCAPRSGDFMSSCPHHSECMLNHYGGFAYDPAILLFQKLGYHVIHDRLLGKLINNGVNDQFLQHVLANHFQLTIGMLKTRTITRYIVSKLWFLFGLNNTPYIEQPRASAPLGADWSVEINADYQKRGRKSKKKYAIKNIILPLSKRDYYAAIAVFPSFY